MSNFFKDLKLIGKATETIEALNYQRTELQSLLENTQAELAQANHAKDQTELSLNETNNALQSTRSELNQFRLKLSNLEIQQTETTEENELLLLQLHQVQEELEHYFLQYQDLKPQSKTTQQRLDRVLADNPNYFSYDKIEFEPVSGNAERLHWKINGLFGAGRYWESCQLDTFVEKGIAGFVFKKERDGTSPLMVWPKTRNDQSEVICIPTGTPDNVQQRAELLKTLSTSDWRLVRLLPEVLGKALKQNPSVEAANDRELLQALHKTNDILQKHIPPRLRFDKIELINTLTRPGYENLSFRLSHLSYAKRLYPEFEFRLGCANVLGNRFGSDPKLEFPLLNGKPQFESWFAESEDEFGPKLEIRFALPDAMDLKVWNMIKSPDQKLISNIVSLLKELIEKSLSESKQITRSYREWVLMAEDLERIFKQCTDNQGQ